MALARSRRQIPQYAKSFTASDWVNDQITVIPVGIPVSGQLGPHLLPTTDNLYETEVHKFKSPGFLKEVGLSIAQYPDGRVVLKKTSSAPSFDGIVLIRANRYE